MNTRSCCQPVIFGPSFGIPFFSITICRACINEVKISATLTKIFIGRGKG